MVRTRISWVPFSSSKEPFEKMTLGESYGLKKLYSLIFSFQMFKITHSFHVICGYAIFDRKP